MTKLITSIFMCLAAIAASAQPKADIEVSYTAHHPNLRNGKDDLTSQYICSPMPTSQNSSHR